MSVFGAPDFEDHETVTFVRDGQAKLSAIVAIHNTARGPALGGCRMWTYEDENEAIADALRLSRGMTYKAALAGLALGGGKSVILGDPRRDKTRELLEAFGRAINLLGGRYVVAEDVGTSVEDMDIIRTQTRHVTGLSSDVGDPSPRTADGVLIALKAAVAHDMGREELRGLRVAVQGLGHVGATLARLLAQEGARLLVADIDEGRVEATVRETGADIVEPDRIHAADVDVFAPCALGAGLNDDTIPEIRARIVCGAANNQLAEARHGAMLKARGIVYVPDYLANAGGLIEVARTALGYSREDADQRRREIGDTVVEVLTRAASEDAPTSEVADRIAEERLKRR